MKRETGIFDSVSSLLQVNGLLLLILHRLQVPPAPAAKAIQHCEHQGC